MSTKGSFNCRILYGGGIVRKDVLDELAIQEDKYIKREFVLEGLG